MVQPWDNSDMDVPITYESSGFPSEEDSGEEELTLRELDKLGTLTVVGGNGNNDGTIAYSNIYARLVQERDAHEYAFLDYAQLSGSGKEAISSLLELHERMFANPLLSSRAYLEMLDEEEKRLATISSSQIRESALEDLNAERMSVYSLINYVRRSGRTMVDFSDVKDALQSKDLRIGKWINRMPWPYQRAYRLAQVDKSDSERWWDFLQRILAPAMSMGRRRGRNRNQEEGGWNPADDGGNE